MHSVGYNKHIYYIARTYNETVIAILWEELRANKERLARIEVALTLTRAVCSYCEHSLMKLAHARTVVISHTVIPRLRSDPANEFFG